MEILNTVFTFVSNNILTKAEFFVGLIVLVGYILLGRKWYETLAGFLKAVVGYMILNVGSAGLINTFRPILAGLNQKFNPARIGRNVLINPCRIKPEVSFKCGSY